MKNPHTFENPSSLVYSRSRGIVSSTTSFGCLYFVREELDNTGMFYIHYAMGSVSTIIISYFEGIYCFRLLSIVRIIFSIR